MLEIPESDIAYDTTTTNSFLKNVHQILKVKMHLHHSHVTGENLSFVHDFCNLRVREDKTDFAVLAHIFFGFDMCFLLKEFRATAWNFKNINIGGTNLTHINFANIDCETKFIDTLKYYQKSLGQLAATLSEVEKLAVKKVAEPIIMSHDYFSETLKYLGPTQKEKKIKHND